jgi:uncharacterized protein YcfJ
MNTNIKLAVAAAAMTLTAQAMAQQITFYEQDGWRGRALTSGRAVNDFSRVGFNDRASSVVVTKGRWEVCDGERFTGTCMVLRPGNYESLRGMGMNDRISSARPISGNRRYQNEAPEPLPVADYQYRRRPNEPVYAAQVTSVRAVVGAPEERCWVERSQVTDNRSNNGNNVGGAIAGALIGGVLGHQIGGGTGRDVATAGGAIAGAAIGNNMSGGNNYGNSGSGNTYAQDVRRCENVQSTTPAYWDVTYDYAGRQHRIQTATAPGSTVLVNRYGEPRQ